MGSSPVVAAVASSGEPGGGERGGDGVRNARKLPMSGGGLSEESLMKGSMSPVDSVGDAEREIPVMEAISWSSHVSSTAPVCPVA